MIESQAAIPMGNELGWDNSQSHSTDRTAKPLTLLLTALMTLVFVMTLAGGTWVYLESDQILKSFETMRASASVTSGMGETRFLTRVGQWQMATTLVTAGVGAILAIFAIRTIRAGRENFTQQLTQTQQEWQRQVNSLVTQLRRRQQGDVDALYKHERQQERLQSQIVELTQSNAALSEELELRRLAEQTLSQQRQELTRSKDVLELHVKARTKALEKLQRRSEMILNSAAEGICGFDMDGNITFANPAAALAMGMDVKDMIGRSESELFQGFSSQTFPADDASNGCQPTEVVAQKQDGSCFDAEYLRSPIEEDGRVVGEVLMFKDITERKRAAEALSQKAVELERSNAELEQFAFVASHDLQEPLRKIQAFGDRLKAKCDDAKLEQGRDYLERMQNAAARMQTLINDLLTFSRVISRTEPFKAVDLTTVAQEVLGDLEFRIEKSKAKVEVGQLPTIDADAIQLGQLLQNLIGNAIKFQRPGVSPVIRIQGHIVVQPGTRGQTAFLTRAAAEGGEVKMGEEICEMTVEDNGIGFDEKYVDKIFAVFTRLHGRQEYEGTGIGLAVCRRIVDRHGGTITARSKQGEGTMFIVRIPVHQSVKLPQRT